MLDRTQSLWEKQNRLVGELLGEHDVDPRRRRVSFLRADYTEPLDLADDGFDLLISLYAGFVSEHCTRYVRPGGFLLVNSSHGDAAMASIDHRYRLSAVVNSSERGHASSTEDLDTYLRPKRSTEVTAERLHRDGRGIAYTRSPFACLFEHLS